MAMHRACAEVEAWVYSRYRDIGHSVGMKPLVWLAPAPRTPPIGPLARRRLGWLLRRLQAGESIGLPESRPMNKAFGPRCHELRVSDGESGLEWRLAYRVDPDAIVVVHWWAKRQQRTAVRDQERVRARLRRYDADADPEE